MAVTRLFLEVVVLAAFVGCVSWLVVRDRRRQRDGVDNLRRSKQDLETQVGARAAELRDSNARLQSVIDSAVDGIIVINATGRIESFNRGAERLFGYPGSEVIGRNVSMLMPSPYHQSRNEVSALSRKRTSGHSWLTVCSMSPHGCAESTNHRAGPVPEIRADGDSIVFYMHVTGVHQQLRLIIRCDGDGSVWASIASERPSEAPDPGCIAVMTHLVSRDAPHDLLFRPISCPKINAIRGGAVYKSELIIRDGSHPHPMRDGVNVRC